MKTPAYKYLFKAEEDELFYAAEEARETRSAKNVEQVTQTLAWIEEQQQKGFFVMASFSYELAQAFDSAHKVHCDEEKFPLIFAASFDQMPLITLPAGSPQKEAIEFDSHINEQEYHQAIAKTHDYIHSGDIYQVNFSFRNDLQLKRSPQETFYHLYGKHPVPYACFMDLEDWQIASLSPELFLEKKGSKLFSKPMKGTAKRALSWQEDQEIQSEMKRDRKTQAENLMIVDLMRNDLSRICQLGSVKVTELFKVDRYPSLHQMISTVEGELQNETSLEDTFKALYPPGSITGAPKIRAMEVINELEKDARQIYTGCVGLFKPSGDYTINVCIRTLLCQNRHGKLGLGSGIVADSHNKHEWSECLLKAHFLNQKEPHHEIFETFSWQDGQFSDLDAHLKRLKESSLYFQWTYPEQEIASALDGLNQQLLLKKGKRRIRLSLKLNSSIELLDFPMSNWPQGKARVQISQEKVSSQDPYRQHKTDRRQLYNSEFTRIQSEGFDEVLFFNEKDELCEGAISNIFILNDKNIWLTPKLSCGLLPGIWRQQMLHELHAIETTITRKEVLTSQKILIGNSLRGPIDAELS